MDNKNDIVRRSQFRRALELVIGKLPEEIDLSPYAKKNEIKAAVASAMEAHVFIVDLANNGTVFGSIDKYAKLENNPLRWNCVPPECNVPVGDVNPFDPQRVFRFISALSNRAYDFPVTGEYQLKNGHTVFMLRPFSDEEGGIVCGEVEVIPDSNSFHFRWWFRERTLTEDEYKSLDVRDPRTTYYIVES